MEDTLGVQEFIDKLKNQGVIEGQREGEKIIKEAHQKAAEIIKKAQEEGDALLSEAYSKMETEKKSFHGAIKTTFRDTEIALRSKVREAFSHHLKRLVSLELSDKDFIKELVLAIARKKDDEIAKAPQAEVLLPSQLFEGDENSSELTLSGKKRIGHLVLGITQDMLREGIELKPGADIKGGIKVRLVGKDIDIDLSDEAISDLLLQYVLPRYRAIISGEDEK